MNKPEALLERFYTNTDTLQQSKMLLGKVLVTASDKQQITAGMITEVEAYCGIEDKACHAFGGRRTARTEMLYEKGGTVYVYLCYGIHHLFNVVVHKADVPHAILIRAIEPLDGLDLMLARRGMEKPAYRLTSGPGSMSKAMGITTTEHNGLSLAGTASTSKVKTSASHSKIWIEDRGVKLKKSQVVEGPRIGVDYAGEDAKLPYRFWIKDSAWVSR